MSFNPLSRALGWAEKKKFQQNPFNRAKKLLDIFKKIHQNSVDC